jgi:hypothetical protein
MKYYYMVRNEKTSREDIAARSIDMTFYIYCRFIVLTLAMLISKWRNYPTQRAFPIGKIMDSLSKRLRFVEIYVCLCMCVSVCLTARLSVCVKAIILLVIAVTTLLEAQLIN